MTGLMSTTRGLSASRHDHRAVANDPHAGADGDGREPVAAGRDRAQRPQSRRRPRSRRAPCVDHAAAREACADARSSGRGRELHRADDPDRVAFRLRGRHLTFASRPGGPCGPAAPGGPCCPEAPGRPCWPAAPGGPCCPGAPARRRRRRPAGPGRPRGPAGPGVAATPVRASATVSRNSMRWALSRMLSVAFLVPTAVGAKRRSTSQEAPEAIVAPMHPFEATR